MTAVIDRPQILEPIEAVTPPKVNSPSWLKRPIWNRFTPLQLLVITLATIPPVIVTGAIGAGLLGAISIEAMTGLALAAGENPGMMTFGAMLLASPVQWITGRSQVRVRKYLGIVFFLLALSNGAMFLFESTLLASLSAPFLIAGTIALVLATPLFLTSSRWSQRKLGMKNWRRLHKLTYLVAIGLLGHVILIGDIGPGAVMIALALVARIPRVRRLLTKRSGKVTSARPVQFPEA